MTRILALGLAGLLFVFHAPAAIAENDSVVVTATRTPTPLDKLPARVEVIDRADIEAQGLATLAQALGPDAIQQGGVGAQTSLFLRGGNSNHVLALFDGVRLNDASTPTGAHNFGLDTLGSVQRIEIVRGPLATFYGTDAIGGVVNTLPRRGGDGPFKPFAEAEAGSFETWRGLLGAAGTTGRLSYGFSAEAYAAEGFDQIPQRIRPRTGHPDGADIDTLIGAARWEGEMVGFDLLTRHRESKIDYDTGFPRTDDPDLEQETSQSLWRLGADAKLTPNLQARISGGAVEGESDDFNGGIPGGHNEFTRDFLDGSLRWSGKALGPLQAPTISVGAMWEREEARVDGGFNDPLDARQDHSGLYVVAQSGFGKGFSATATARTDDYDGFGAHTTFALGLSRDLHAVGAPVRLFASYGTAFHAPSLSERFASSLFQVPNPGLKPEESETWEIGADWEILADKLVLKASYYKTDVDNLVSYNFLTLQNENINRARIDGAELRLDYRPASWLDLGLAYAWTDTADLSASPTEPLPRRPENTLRFQATARPIDRLSLVLHWSWVDERWDYDFDNAGSPAFVRTFIDAYDVGGLAATFELTDQVQIFGRVDNLTDAEYEPTAGYAASPRAVFVGVRLKP